MKRAVLLLILFLTVEHNANAKTLILKGELNTSINVTQRADFEVNKKIDVFKYRFALPSTYNTKISSQKIKRLKVDFSPEPTKVTDIKDKYGNNFKEVYYEKLTGNVTIQINFDVDMETKLTAIESSSVFPLKNIPEEAKVYLKSTKLVQSDAEEIVTLAKRLTSNSLNLYEAVNNIINFVSDNVKYTYNPPQYDALYTLKTQSGNCQNFAHLSIALLRAVNIPARIVGGISLKEPWKVPAGKGSTLVQSMGQGGHAWIEVYFPDLGWLLYDPQQTKQFTSTRHIKQTHGLDSNDINDSWQASPYLPKYEESIDARFSNDNIAINLEGDDAVPKAYLLSNVVKSEKRATPLPPVEEKPVKPVKPEPIKDKVLIFGNTNFPNLVDLYTVSEDRATKVFDKETAEYVTSKDIYAQAFTIDEALSIKTVSLAMHKFGGDGAVYIDLLEDESGKPSLRGIRSDLLFLDKIPRKQGYYWVDFTFSGENQKLQKGRYWIVLRKSGEAIMNWFYIPANPYGDGDDTRSTAKGWQWEDLLNYDFVFKVTAERIN
ncbi:MAG: transglutaminase-like domain-containing protein [bacterium]